MPYWEVVWLTITAYSFLCFLWAFYWSDIQRTDNLKLKLFPVLVPVMPLVLLMTLVTRLCERRQDKRQRDEEMRARFGDTQR